MENNKEVSENKQCDIHVVMQKKFIKCFKLYKKIKSELDFYVSKLLCITSLRVNTVRTERFEKT